MIRAGRLVDGALRRLGLRRSEIDHAVRLQVETGSVESGGQLMRSLRSAAQAATKADIEGLDDRLARMEAFLAAPR